MKVRVLHVETGGSYGGSLRALELYLKHSDCDRFDHSLLLLRPVNGVERLTAHLSEPPIVLSASENSNGSGPGKALPEIAKTGASRRFLSEAWDWARLGAGVFRARTVSRQLQRGKYDLIHVNNTFPHQGKVLMAARFANIPVVGHVRNPVENTKFNRTMMRWTAGVATVSRQFERELNDWDLATTVRTCYDGIEVRKADSTKVPGLRRDLLRGGAYLFGSVGRLDEQKGYVHFVEAARIVAEQEKGAGFVIGGDGPQREMLQALIEQHSLQNKIQLCGFRTDVPEFVSSLDCFVSSSQWEGLPIAIVEAMLLRKPVVATAVGGNAEVFPGREHELVPSGDPAALAGKMLHVMRTSPTNEELEQSATFAGRLTDPVRSAAALDQIFAELAVKAGERAKAAVMDSI